MCMSHSPSLTLSLSLSLCACMLGCGCNCVSAAWTAAACQACQLEALETLPRASDLSYIGRRSLGVIMSVVSFRNVWQT